MKQRLRCSGCKSLKKRSQVVVTSDLVGGKLDSQLRYYDVTGRYHDHEQDPLHLVYRYECSEGHVWKVSDQKKVGCWCGWSPFQPL